MKKLKPIIVISAILIITGIGLTIYESQLINENVTNQQQNLVIGGTIFNPLDEIIASKQITKNLFQENFTVVTQGIYKVQIENQGQRTVQVLAIIGNYPQNTSLLDMFGFIVLIIGLGDLAIGIMYFVKNRGNTNVS